MSIFQAGARALAAAINASAGVAVLYSRGVIATNTKAAVAHSTYTIETGDNQFVEQVTTRDFIFRVEDIGMFMEPQPGDRITEFDGRGATVGLYEAMPLGSEACYRYSDDFQQQVRVHTKRVG